MRRGDDDYAVPYDDQPIVTWTVAIVVSLIEAYVPILLNFLKPAVSLTVFMQRFVHRDGCDGVARRP